MAVLKFDCPSGVISKSYTLELEVVSGENLGEANQDVVECTLKYKACNFMKEFENYHDKGLLAEGEEKRKEFIKELNDNKDLDKEFKRKMKKVCQKKKLMVNHHISDTVTRM
jgi:hypothetical protein